MCAIRGYAVKVPSHSFYKKRINRRFVTAWERKSPSRQLNPVAQRLCRFLFNSLTPKCILAGTKNSRSEEFLLTKHTSHQCPHHDEPFSHLAAWF
jgi:hypothetical protein